MSQKDLIKAIQNSDESIFNEVISKDKSLEGATIKGSQIGAMRIHTIDCGNTEWEACIFDGTEFDSINLQGAFFNGCTFYNCTFKNVILAEASFDGCVFNKSSILEPEDLEAAEITNSQFKECTLSKMHFVDSVLESLTMTAGKIESMSGIATLKSVVLRNVEVTELDTSEMELTGCIASGCTSVPKGFVVSEGKRRRV
ncbi:MAG: pentapeptide repeat-containing protein [Proteobacteria bacterium]|nr:pentapeptide repeat-containing protein [Pseudomonadota bacterium]